MKLIKSYLNDFQPLYWWFRSADSYGDISVGCVGSVGNVSNNYYYKVYGVAPVCVI